MTAVRGSKPWKVLEDGAPVNKPDVDWFNAVTNALTTMGVQIITSPQENDTAGIERTNANGRGWKIKIPLPPTALPPYPDETGYFALMVKLTDGEPDEGWPKWTEVLAEQEEE